MTIAGFVALLFAVLMYFWTSPSGLTQAPDTELTLIDGNKLRLKDFRGKPMLITFWATTCPGCLKEMPHLVELHNELAARGLKIIGIAMHYDPPSQVVTLIKQRSVPYSIALDIDKTAMRAFGIRELTPNSFLVAPDGRIVYHKIGEMDMNKVHDMILEMLK